MSVVRLVLVAGDTTGGTAEDDAGDATGEAAGDAAGEAAGAVACNTFVVVVKSDIDSVQGIFVAPAGCGPDSAKRRPRYILDERLVLCSSEVTEMLRFSEKANSLTQLTTRSMLRVVADLEGAGKDGTDDEEDGDGDDCSRDTVREDSGYDHGQSNIAISKKFFSDTNPESALLNRSASRGGLVPVPNGDLGVWVDRREWNALIKQKNDAEAAIELTARHGQRPHPSILEPLIDLYFAKIHPLLPIIEETEFRERHAADLVPEPLVHVMCLVVAKHAEASSLLRLTDSTTPLPPRKFCKGLHDSIISALSAPSRYDKITQIRILALASLHSEGPDGNEEASMFLSQALHHAQTLGLQLGQHQGHRDLANKRLFWSLWILDRSNSAMHGRPIMMSDLDIANEPFAPGESGFPAFDAYYRISAILNKVISFYRPHNPVDTTGWEEQFPGLEEIFDDVNAWQLPESIIATLHMFYLTVAILSHRCRGIKQIPRGTHSSIRQRLCASEIIRFMESSAQRAILHPLPCIPYATSLSLSVQYQHLRQSQITHQQQDAHVNFRAATQILAALRPTWSSADSMATLARKVLDEIDRAPDLRVFRIPRDLSSRAAAAAAAAGEDDQAIGPPTACPGITDISTSNAEGEVAPEEPVSTLPSKQAIASFDGLQLFDGMDDVFGTYLDPNYPVNLEDFTFVDDEQHGGGAGFTWEGSMAAETYGG
nr:cutinase transcription factor 1 alpha [Quercus suber]